MNFLPISINIENKRILIVGGGRIALHKVKLLEPFTNNFTIVAPQICDELLQLGYQVKQRQYEKADLTGHFLVYACTNIINLNLQVKADAHQLNILVNLVDNPQQCDFVSPAIYKDKNMTVAVSSNGQDVYRSIEWRNQIRQFLQSGECECVKTNIKNNPIKRFVRKWLK